MKFVRKNNDLLMKFKFKLLTVALRQFPYPGKRSSLFFIYQNNI